MITDAISSVFYPLLQKSDEPELCPVLLLLSLAFADQAFKATSLKSPKDITHLLSVPLQAQSLQIEWKDSMLNVPIFRSIAKSHGIDPIKALPYERLLCQLKSLGVAAGFKYPVTPYCFRRGAGNAIEGRATKSQRMQAMGHDSEHTFKHYISQDIRIDTQSAFLEEEEKKDTLAFIGAMLLTRDLRAPTTLTIEQRKEVDKDPEVAQLLVKRNQWRTILQEKYKSISRASESSDPATIANYNHFVKSKRDLDIASRKVLRRTLQRARAEWWASIGASDINSGLSQASTALSLPSKALEPPSHLRSIAILFFSEKPRPNRGL